MSNPSRKPLAILVLCLCLCSLFVAPVFHVQGATSVEMTETETDPVEYEEDLLSAHGGRSAFASILSLRLGARRLYAHSAALSPAFLPPKHSRN